MNMQLKMWKKWSIKFIFREEAETFLYKRMCVREKEENIWRSWNIPQKKSKEEASFYCFTGKKWEKEELVIGSSKSKARTGIVSITPT